MDETRFGRRGFVVLLTALAAIVAVWQGGAQPSSGNGGSDSLQFGDYPVQHPPVFQRGNRLSQPLPEGSPEVEAFLAFFSRYVHERVGAELPADLRKIDVRPFPSTLYGDIGVAPRDYGTDLPPGEARFATSSYCQDCHDAALTLAGRDPPMRVPDREGNLYADWSPYGEWSVSLMGLSARDPVFHAQVETERDRHPGVDPVSIDNVCYSCHGPMGQRQLQQDLGQEFNHFMIYSTPDNFAGLPKEGGAAVTPEFAEYGALARDSVSCELCHHIGPSDGVWSAGGEVDWSVFYGARTEEYPAREDPPGPPYPFTANFQDNLNRLYVPSEGVSETEEPMLLLGMARAEQTPHIQSSEYCGGCHVVIVPKIPEGYRKGAPVQGKPGQTYTGDPFTDPNVGLAYEQTTYFEYANSGFPARDVQCQTCHMPGLSPAGEKVASVSPAWYTPEYPDIPKRDYNRHRLLGINLFVHEMFQQFYGILGLADPLRDDVVPADTAANLLSAEQSIVQHATQGPFGEATAAIAVTAARVDGGSLTASVTVTNNSGHKFPSGAGFRRGWVELEVLDAGGEVLWASGSINPFGVIVGPDGMPLPSEFTTQADRLQPHYTEITRRDQVQIYEVRTQKPVHGTEGPSVLTTQTLSLFEDAKDNRILPSGWTPPADVPAGATRFGLDQATLATITEPHDVGEDPDYSDPQLIGTDSLVFEIPLADLGGRPARVRASMRYQTIPPYFLVDRYVDGYSKTKKQYGPATTRLIYLTAHLDTNLGLTSAGMSVDDFDVIGQWTMTLSRDTVAVDTAAY
ncbi:MAG TPA: hypothetical protein VGG06_15445 [Thermoanaerobaculia bacterium]|jgi:hypothetical protein